MGPAGGGRHHGSCSAAAQLKPDNHNVTVGIDFPAQRNVDRGTHNVNVRIVKADGKLYYEFYGKTANDDLANYVRAHKDWKAAGPRAYMGSVQDGVAFEEDSAKIAQTAGTDRVKYVETPHGVAELRVDINRWYEDDGGTDIVASRSFRMRVPVTGDDRADYGYLRQLVQGTPLEGVLETATEEEGRRVGMIRAITDQRPGIMSGYRSQVKGSKDGNLLVNGVRKRLTSKDLWKMTEAELKALAKENGMSLKLDSVQVRELKALGYSTQTIDRGIDYQGRARVPRSTDVGVAHRRRHSTRAGGVIA